MNETNIYTPKTKVRDRILLALALIVALGGIVLLFTREEAEAPKEEERRSATEETRASKTTSGGIVFRPAWISDLIQEIESEPVANPPASITQYEYKGEVVYYYQPGCCDKFTELYTTEGALICAPDGGITGEGDGACPDFFEERTNSVFIWSDIRGETPQNDGLPEELHLI